MKTLITTIATIAIFAPVLFLTEQHRRGDGDARSASPATIMADSLSPSLIRANGRVQGMTDEIELRSQISEVVRQIHVSEGDWVTGGDPLITLASDRLSHELSHAKALMSHASAKLAQLENGHRDSEIDTAAHEYRAVQARLSAAEKTLARAIRLSRSDALSQQMLDDSNAEVEALQAAALAAKARLDTLQAPPREDERLAAQAAVDAAEAQFRIAEVNLQRATIRAPSTGRVLAVDVEIGELTGPQSPDPICVLADTREYRVMAEIDEFDALRVRPGQTCSIRADATAVVIGRGLVTSVEPRMQPKRLFRQWAGEPNDTSTRRIWISLEDCDELPVGLPVDVLIEDQ